MILLRLALFLFLGVAPAATAHEFWIEPEQYQIEPEAAFAAYLRNGEQFKGVSLAYFESRFTRFEMISGKTVLPVEGRLGDSPALQGRAPGNGLLIVVHETTPQNVTYRDWEKFLKFTRHKDFPSAAADHEARGWPKDRFRESYTRHVKTLIAVGDGAGTDNDFGLKTEFIALENPYAPDFAGPMRVALRYEGQPRTDAQVEVFDRAPDGTVDVTFYRTDAAGEAEIPVSPGHEYLFDAVVLRPSPTAGSSEDAPLWETYWAALTFAVPDR